LGCRQGCLAVPRLDGQYRPVSLVGEDGKDGKDGQENMHKKKELEGNTYSEVLVLRKIVSLKTEVSHALINTNLQFGPPPMHPRRKVLCTHECVLLDEEEKKKRREREEGGQSHLVKFPSLASESKPEGTPPQVPC
jgi:hypothetical protein